MAHGVDQNWFEPQSSPKSIKSDKKSAAKSVRPDGKGVGSRRIFSPIFKLQVLDSYRQDADCQGNQRATARKYGIHRRQIQKWLQMETSLRSSVQQTAAKALNLSSARHQEENSENIEINNASSPVSTISKISSSTCYLWSSTDSVSNFHNKGQASDSEEYINVDEVTDTEDDDLESWSSYEKLDKALDFTCATLSKRRFYTSDFKLHVLDSFRNDVTCKGNQRATARKFGIHRRQVQKWLNRENAIKLEQNSSDLCLDLSHGKRKLEELEEYRTPCAKRKSLSLDMSPVAVETFSDVSHGIQESALCLVKEKLETEHQNLSPVCTPITMTSLTNQVHSNSLEHAYQGTSLCYTSPIPMDYPMYCIYSPWNCCYQAPSPTGNVFENTKYAYSLDFRFSKYETSYADIPLQYGFGENLSSNWIKEPPPFYIHEQPMMCKF